MVKDISISDYTYSLPDERIARHPLSERDACKLLISTSRDSIRHDIFSSLPDFLPAGSLIVCNDTRVINARIKFEKATGSKIEVFLLEPVSPEDYVLSFQTRTSCTWSCMIGNLKRWKSGVLTKHLLIDGKDVVLTAERKEARDGNAHKITFSWNDADITFASIVDAAGYIPIPPYLKRNSEETDSDDYQTVYARVKGSVAAPTAGLHFTDTIFDAVRNKDIDIQYVTLHVGAGTFQPVKSEQIGGHPMHTEVFTVSRQLVESLIDAIESNRMITAVGTTTVRTLESLPLIGTHLAEKSSEPLLVSQWEAYNEQDESLPLRKSTLCALKEIIKYLDSTNALSLTASTSIMIAPGFKWRIVNGLVTNFHQPGSTLLLLVASFLGDSEKSEHPRWLEIYNEALAGDYRFLSYGDACFFSNYGLST